MKRFLLKLLFPFFLFAFSSAYSQSYTVQVKQFQVGDGLFHRFVHTVIEDKAGFIWIGTDKGLQRFNGHNFKPWSKNSPTGKFYEVTLLLIDLEGWLWVWNNDIQEFVFLHTITEEILSQEERFGKDFPIIRNAYDGGFRNGIGTDSKGRIVCLSSNILL